jgi:hypothetical protein
VTRQQHEAQFIEMIRERYDGHAKVEIPVILSNDKTSLVLPEGARTMSVRLLLGMPEIIGAEMEYPVELPAFGTYNPERDGEMSEDAATGFMLRSALWRTYPGAPVLLKVPTLWTPGELPKIGRRTSGR